jgi:hypothetical protein
MLPSLGVFSLAGSFRCLFLLLFLGALYVVWVFFYVGLFSVRTFFFFFKTCDPLSAYQVPGSVSSSFKGRRDKHYKFFFCGELSHGVALDEGQAFWQKKHSSPWQDKQATATSHSSEA